MRMHWTSARDTKQDRDTHEERLLLERYSWRETSFVWKIQTDTRFQSVSYSDKKICRRVNLFWTKRFFKINQISTLKEILVISFPLTTLDNNYRLPHSGAHQFFIEQCFCICSAGFWWETAWRTVQGLWELSGNDVVVSFANITTT